MRIMKLFHQSSIVVPPQQLAMALLAMHVKILFQYSLQHLKDLKEVTQGTLGSWKAK